MSEDQVINEQELDGKSSEDLQAMLDGLVNESEPATEPNEPEAEGEKQPAPASEEPSVDSLKEMVAKLQKQVQDKEAFILQRNQEIGLLRKKAREAQPEPELDITDEEMIASPKEALKKALKQHEQRKAEAQTQQEQEAQDFRRQAQEAISAWAPKYDETVPEIIELMKADQAPESLLSQFKSDPVATLNPAVTFQLIKRIEAQRRIKELETQLAEAQKRPADMVSKIQQAGRAKPVATTTPPSPKKHAVLDNLTEADIDRMSADELKKLEEQLLKSTR